MTVEIDWDAEPIWLDPNTFQTVAKPDPGTGIWLPDISATWDKLNWSVVQGLTQVVASPAWPMTITEPTTTFDVSVEFTADSGIEMQYGSFLVGDLSDPSAPIPIATGGLPNPMTPGTYAVSIQYGDGTVDLPAGDFYLMIQADNRTDGAAYQISFSGNGIQPPPPPTNDSIFIKTKKALGLAEDYTPFDVEVLMYINSVLSTLTQLGVGPRNGFQIEDETAQWSDLTGGDKRLNMVKSYVYQRVRLLFDAPTIGFVLTAIKNEIDQLEWRITVVMDEINQDILDAEAASTTTTS